MADVASARRSRSLTTPLSAPDGVSSPSAVRGSPVGSVDKSMDRYVDVGSQPTPGGDPSAFVISEIEGQLENKYGFDVT